VKRLKFGRHPRGGTVQPQDFVTIGTRPLAFELPVPDGARSARLLVTAELDVSYGEDCIVRCTLSQLEETDQGKSVSGLLASPDSTAFETWKAGVLEFARILPQMSHREPAPSDRDPVPPPVDATYNHPERNFYHTRIKYFRDDGFLVQNILDGPTRLELDQAWADLRGSFDYYETWLEFLDRKYGLHLDGRRISEVDNTWISQTPGPARGYLRSLKSDFKRTVTMFQTAESAHLQDVAAFASRAWRRPLTEKEQHHLAGFYRTLRDNSGLDHRSALVAVVSRILVSPHFLYRSERMISDPVSTASAVAPLSQWELAGRLSFLVWSSVPDAELSRAALAGELSTSAQISAQLQRMLQAPESRRFAVEFFGQWFGFYRFHQFRGIDAEHFPEFTDSLRQSLYTEAIEFCDYVVRRDRPVSELLDADYTFVNRELAAHYSLSMAHSDRHVWHRIRDEQRGGLLRMGAILAVTSAPRRTSPVKRGDWVLRRVLGTAVPPPPADAGSIAADEVIASGLSIRQRLVRHRRDVTCHNCHSRFDALGFALENYDPLGRWRTTYGDTTPVENAGVLGDGTGIDGASGLRDYLTDQRVRFYQTTAEKMIGYALGRQVSIGDRPLVARMKQHMKGGGGVHSLLEQIVTSRQFRYHRTGRTLSAPGNPEPANE
ncbi:MAG: DUF1592 domain-containing protein, partial [Planctomycetaceae bacterium]